MGCALSGSGVTPGPAVSEEKRGASPGDEVDSKAESEGGGAMQMTIKALPLSGAEKDLIRGSWQVLHKDIARVGIIVFIR